MRDVGLLQATVREWRDDDGWGVVEGPDLPGPCWVHFSVIEMTGYHALVPGARVRVVVEPMDVEGFSYSAVRVVLA